MANKNSNYPSARADELNGEDFTGSTIGSLMELSSRGAPETVSELERRIEDYFSFCQSRNLRPGIETLSLSLSVNRSTFWRWCCGERRVNDPRWTEVCLKARQVIISFLECASMSGRLNPATSIFLLKNWASYSDNSPVEPMVNDNATLAVDQLPRLDISGGTTE